VFNKFFGKKNDGFYLQVEDDNNAPKPEAKAKAKSQPAADTAKVAAVVTPPVAITSADPAAPAATTTATPTAKSDANAAKATAKAEKEVAKAAKKSVKKVDAKTADPKKVAVAPAPVAAPAPAAPPITNFATDYLIKPSSTSSRRLPGANMSMFMDMARQAKIPVTFKK
jgi:hypothetical protein